MYISYISCLVNRKFRNLPSRTFVNDAKFGLRLRMAVPEICLVLAPTKYSFYYKGREKAEVDADDVYSTLTSPAIRDFKKR